MCHGMWYIRMDLIAMEYGNADQLMHTRMLSAIGTEQFMLQLR